MKSPEEQVQCLVAQGVDETIAIMMVNSAMKTQNKPTVSSGKKRPAFFSSNPKVEIVLIHEDTCQTCGCVVTERHVTKGYEDEDGTTVKGVRTICHNCPAFLTSLGAEVLASLILIQNHPDQAIHLLPTSMQVRLAQMKPAKDWVGKKIVRQDMSVPEYDKK